MVSSSGASQDKPKLRHPEPSTPGNSPARGATMGPATPSGGGGGQKTSYAMKHSDSSFGLHSPDSFNDDVQVCWGRNK